MTSEVNANDVVAFVVEVVALVLISMWAWRIPAPSVFWLRALAVVAVLGIAMALWGLFAAPQSTFDQPLIAVLVKILVLGGSALAGYAVLPGPLIASVWAAIVVINTILIYFGPFARY